MKYNSNPFRLGRILVSVTAFGLLTGLFVDYGMTVPALAGWLAKIQLFPAAMSFAITTFVGWMIATLVFGRIYCSSVCPLGVFQDICARLPRLVKLRPKWFYHYSTPLTGLRRVSLFIVVLSIFLGISLVTSLLDPYSIYGRFCTNILKPVWGEMLNFMARVNDSPPLRIAVASWLGFAIAAVTILLIGMLAFRNGRTFCNSVCPVGTTLGFVSRYSIFHIDINTDRCVQCRRCEHVCKASCIDLTDHVVDMSRCVVCFDCLSDCPNDAIRYTYRRHQLSIPLMQRVRNPLAGSATGMTDTAHARSTSHGPVKLDRRRFLSVVGMAAALPAVGTAADVASGVEEAMIHPLARASFPVTPPGAKTRREFLDRCTACGLCITHCPQGVLQPSLHEYGLLRALHPVMDYDRSWCIYNCTRCSNLCPTGALLPLTLTEKHAQRIGVAVVDMSLCLSYTGEARCGVCERRCPTGAIGMSADSGRGPGPVVDVEACVGCGSCQYVCPARPVKAIRVAGMA